MRNKSLLWFGQLLADAKPSSIFATLISIIALIISLTDEESRKSFFSFIDSFSSLLYFVLGIIIASCVAVFLLVFTSHKLGMYLLNIVSGSSHKVKVEPLVFPDSEGVKLVKT